MAIYHYSGQVVTRSAGRSSVAASAYRSAVKMTDARTGEVHDFTRKEGVYHSEVMTPDHAPAWMSDREALWQSVEEVERRKDAQLAREFNIALPVELTTQQQIDLARDFVKKEFVDRGMVAQLDLHDLLSHNPHFHAMLSMRDIEGDGWGKKNRDWNDKALLQHWREAWAETANRHLAQAGHAVRIDHRSLADQGANDREPQTHMGQHATAVERKTGEPSRRRQDWQEAMQARAQEAAAAKVEEAALAAELAVAQHQVEVLELDLAEAELDQRIKPRPVPQPERLPRAPARASTEIRRDLEQVRGQFEEPSTIVDRSDVVLQARKRAAEAQRRLEDMELEAGKRRNHVDDGRERLKSTRKQLSAWKSEHPFMRWWHEHVLPVKAAQAMERTITKIEGKLPDIVKAAKRSDAQIKAALQEHIQARDGLLATRQGMIEKLEVLAKPERERLAQLELELSKAIEREKPSEVQQPKPEPAQAQPARWVDGERSEPSRSYPRPRG
jgi:predicted  nucleic acid-binding Zn-ribbon protein